ncbi:24696_t:CDS:2 [Cetraspora pellucida]|uniref:24696_t:CDS:1 n=1 Tax=Cetraspora pellucida TaxID=1433469 RepID=A0A9N9AMB7_9GLOM|nr:24696_t:CDS:2 [Cetraspora pellucida]
MYLNLKINKNYKNFLSVNEEIAIEFNCDRSTVSKILKQKQWSNVKEILPNSNVLKIVGPKFPQVEKALEMWVGTAEQQQLTLIGDVIRQKALQFAKLLNVSEDEFKASQGWLIRFKELQNILEGYEPYNIFNTDECSLYYCIDPSFSLSTVAQKANMSGTEKITSLVINKSKMPNAFHEACITSYNQLLVDYHYNEKAWMRQNIFKKFLDGLQNRFRIQERKILLLVDNATSHAINNSKEYPNILINDFDEGVEKPEKIDVLQAMRLVKSVWDEIKVHISEIVTAQCEAQEIINLTDSSNIQQLAQDYLDNDEFIATEEVIDNN